MARVAEDGVRRLVAALNVALASTPEGIALAKVREELSQKQEAIKVVEAKVRELALDNFYVTENSRPEQGVQIRLFSKVVYESLNAWAWCVEHARKYLLLDNKAFEKAAPVLRDLGAPVKVVKEARVTIATDLGVWLQDPLLATEEINLLLLATEEINLLREEQQLAETES
jgi:hypothetical protein